MVQPAENAKGIRRDGYANGDRDAGRNIAPDGSSIYSIIIPDDGIDKLIEATYTSPKHVETGACVPSFQMPWKWDRDHNEAQESENGV
jgi:hypothetical protein